MKAGAGTIYVHHSQGISASAPHVLHVGGDTDSPLQDQTRTQITGLQPQVYHQLSISGVCLFIKLTHSYILGLKSILGIYVGC